MSENLNPKIECPKCGHSFKVTSSRRWNPENETLCSECLYHGRGTTFLVKVRMQALQPSSRVKVLQAKWIQPDGGEQWLATMARGTTLNVCSGISMVGNVRLDISPKSNRTEYGSLDKLEYPRGSFDTVICDPPFSYYRRFKWVYALADIAKLRFILSGPLVAFYLGSQWKEELYALKSGGRFLRLRYVFDRLDERLSINT